VALSLLATQLGGSIEMVHNPVSIVEIAIEKGASKLLLPVSTRKQLIDLSDDMALRSISSFLVMPGMRY
jgi:predicted ATP-dependent Lon-type protease